MSGQVLTWLKDNRNSFWERLNGIARDGSVCGANLFSMLGPTYIWLVNKVSADQCIPQYNTVAP